MPKMKTNRATAKRFRRTGSGKIKRWQAFKSHILTKKTRKRKRNLKRDVIIDSANATQLKKLLPYL